MNLAAPLRTAVMGNAQIVERISTWKGEPAVFTRRPVPADADYPMVVISPDVAISDADGLRSSRPVILRDIAVYGEQPKQYRVVEEVGYLVRRMFHRQRFSITVPDFHVMDITVLGPIPGPTDTDKHLARIATLTIRLRDLSA